MLYAVYAVIAVILMLAGLSIASRFISNHGLSNEKLRSCTDKPNCVCSEDYPNQNYQPIDIGTMPSGEAWAVLKKVVTSTGGNIKQDDGHYMWAIYVTPLMRFVDDVELRLDENNRLIHIRSASRVGRGDMGANRQRVNRIVSRFKSEINKYAVHPQDGS